ncbi:MAG TPA: pilus assembly protein TadG-related protein [Candidatus Baltobacterales bacterium]|nr:pilus assembly protein TadG-related protein [Candidatus Baltobacterales bacterium]
MSQATRQSQRGQAILITGAMLVALTILGVLVFDAGLGMSDRRNLQAYADAAALAGARSYGPGGNSAHWVAMEYLGSSLGFGLPTGSCASPASCPAGSYTIAGYTVTLIDSWRVNGILDYPSVLDVLISHRQPSIFARMIGFNTLTIAASARATTPGPQINGAAYAVAAVSGDAMINGGGAAFQTVTGPVYAYGSFGANNGPHSTGVPSVQTNFDGTVCPGSPANRLDNGGGSNGLNFHTTDGNPMPENSGIPPPTNYDNASPVPAAPTPMYFSAAAAQDGSGNWMPGIYNGFAPSGGKMNGGVYKIINSPSLALGSITNTIHTPSGTSDPAGAVAIVLDSSDTGALDLSQAVLNGLDDLNPPGYVGVRDPMGTHNFVVWGGNGANAYTAGITIGPHAGTDMSGIIYLPKSPYVSDGNSSPQFTGSVMVASMTVQGGGNGQQVFKWVCGLNAIAGQPYQGGLVR